MELTKTSFADFQPSLTMAIRLTRRNSASKLMTHSPQEFFAMNKKDINSPLLTANFVIWFCGVGCLLLLIFLGHYMWKVF
jgi:hypothetical protein